MLFLYFATLLIPLVLSFFLDGDDADDEFYSIFSINKVLFFANGMLLGHLSGLSPFYGLFIAVFQVGVYFFAIKLLRGLEYKSHKAIVLPGSTGVVYTKCRANDPGLVNIGGEYYKAISQNQMEISAFKTVKIIAKLDSNILIVEEINSQGEK